MMMSILFERQIRGQGTGGGMRLPRRVARMVWVKLCACGRTCVWGQPRRQSCRHETLCGGSDGLGRRLRGVDTAQVLTSAAMASGWDGQGSQGIGTWSSDVRAGFCMACCI